MAEGEGETGIDTSSTEFKKAAEEWLESQGIKKALDSEREARKELETKLKNYGDVDPEEYRELKQAREKAEAERAREEGKFEELLEKEREKFKAELQKRDEKVKAMESSLHRTLVESAAKSAIARAEGDVDLLLPHVERAADIIEDGDQHVAVVVDQRGEPRLAPDAQGATDYMTIEQLVQTWRDEGKYAGAFAGTGASGGGASAGAGTGGSGSGTKKVVDESEFLSNLDSIAKGETAVKFESE